MSTDWDEQPKKRGRGWGGESEGTPLGGEDRVVVGKVVKSSPPRTKAVIAIKAYFQTKLGGFSEAKHVPLWENVGKLHNNIDYMIKQGHSQDILWGAIDYYVTQVPNLMFQGTSLWDEFFARREDYIKYAATAVIGSHGAHTETQDEEARRLASIRYRDVQQDRSK